MCSQPHHHLQACCNILGILQRYDMAKCFKENLLNWNFITHKGKVIWSRTLLTSASGKIGMPGIETTNPNQQRNFERSQILKFFTSSDPHRDISKQPCGCCEMSCWGKVETLAQVSLFSPTLMFDHKIAPGSCHCTWHHSHRTMQRYQPHITMHHSHRAEAGGKHAKNMSIRLRAPPVKHFGMNRTHVKKNCTCCAQCFANKQTCPNMSAHLLRTQAGQWATWNNLKSSQNKTCPKQASAPLEPRSKACKQQTEMPKHVQKLLHKLATNRPVLLHQTSSDKTG